MKMVPMELVGQVVPNIERAVLRYQRAFGFDFRIVQPGIDYEVKVLESGEDEGAPLPRGYRMAIEAEGRIELFEDASSSGAFRNVHVRVDDIEAARTSCIRAGFRLAVDVQAGGVREIVFSASSNDGVRLCLLEYEGNSFVKALLGSK